MNALPASLYVGGLPIGASRAMRGLISMDPVEVCPSAVQLNVMAVGNVAGLQHWVARAIRAWDLTGLVGALNLRVLREGA